MATMKRALAFITAPRLLRRNCQLPTAQSEFTIAPLRRFPPLREGNQAHRFPLLAGGT
jgi:hypothetical protein